MAFYRAVPVGIALQKMGVLCLPIKVYVCVYRHKSGFRSPDFPVIVCMCIFAWICISSSVRGCRKLRGLLLPRAGICGGDVLSRSVMWTRKLEGGVFGDGGAREDVPGDLLHS